MWAGHIRGADDQGAAICWAAMVDYSSAAGEVSFLRGWEGINGAFLGILVDAHRAFAGLGRILGVRERDFGVYVAGGGGVRWVGWRSEAGRIAPGVFTGG